MRGATSKYASSLIYSASNLTRDLFLAFDWSSAGVEYLVVLPQNTELIVFVPCIRVPYVYSL